MTDFSTALLFGAYPEFAKFYGVAEITLQQYADAVNEKSGASVSVDDLHNLSLGEGSVTNFSTMEMHQWLENELTPETIEVVEMADRSREFYPMVDLLNLYAIGLVSKETLCQEVPADVMQRILDEGVTLNRVNWEEALKAAD